MERACSRSLLGPLEPGFERDVFVQFLGRYNQDMESEHAYKYPHPTDAFVYIQRPILAAFTQHIERCELG